MGLKKEEKQGFFASLSLSPHILLLMPATHFQFFPLNFLPPDLLPLQFLWIRAAPVFCYYSEFSLLLFCKEVVPEGGHQVESGMVVRPPGLQLRHLQLYFRDHTSTHSHVIPSIIVKQSNLQKYVSLSRESQNSKNRAYLSHLVYNPQTSH